MDDETTAEGPSGYIRVRLIVGQYKHDLWQVVQQGGVLGYLDSKGAIFEVPQVHEMTVLDPDLQPNPF